MNKLYGVTVAMITPFTADNRVDYDALSALVEFLIARGVHCLYPCGTTGEMFHLSIEERKCIAEHVVRQADGRVTVYIHAGAMRAENTLALAAHAHAIGASGIGVVTPAFFGMTDNELYGYYHTIATAVPSDFPIYLYNIPQLAVNDLSVATVARLANEHENIVGIKYSLADLLRTDEYLHVKPGFSVMHGADRLFLPTLAMGCDGTVSGVASVYPELFVAVYDAFCRQDLAQCRVYQGVATRFCNLLRSGANMAYFKEGLAHRGVYAGHMREPLLDLPESEAKALRTVLKEAEDGLPAGLLV